MTYDFVQSILDYLLRFLTFLSKKNCKRFAYLSWINRILWANHNVLSDILNSFKSISKRKEKKYYFDIFIAYLRLGKKQIPLKCGPKQNFFSNAAQESQKV